MNKIVYGYDAKTYIYTGPLTLDESDRSPVTHEWLIPAHYTDVEPPAEQDGYNIVWKGDMWALEAIPAPPEPPEPTPPTPEEKIAMLDADYSAQKATLCQEYTDAIMHSDQATADALVQEMTELDAWYDEEYQKIVGGEQ